MIAGLMLSLLVSQASPDVTLRRFALVAGANNGGSSRVTLRYANSDARAVSRVFTQLGGVAEQDLFVVEDPSVKELGTAFDRLASRVGGAHSSESRTEVVFYYSGHSDEEGLLLKGERLSYEQLRARLNGIAAEVRIAVLDSCASGALNRSKGGVPRPSFLLDQSSQLIGHAFLTSASADEAAQESDRLKASIFTHFLVSGLRGAADANRDGRVTLGETYQYAFSETLARTTSTRAGPQRPGYDIQLVGTGDLVLTDVRSATSRLVLEPSVGGRVYVLGAQGGLVVEVAKALGKPIELGLEPGEYRVVVDDGEHPGEALVSLAVGDSKALSRDSLSSTSLEATVLRGDEEVTRPWLPVDLALVYPMSFAGAVGPAPRVNVGLGILAERVGAVDGALLSSVVGWVDDEVRGAALAGAVLKVGGLRGLAASGAVLVSTGDAMGLTTSVLTITRGDVLGGQVGVLNLTSGATRGLQVGVGNLSVAGFTGLLTGVANVAMGPSLGAQVGVANVGGDMKGLSISAGLNLGVGDLVGGEVATLNVRTGTTLGAQIGVVNVGGDLTGGQLGVINIASHVKGAQVGVINIAQTSDAPVGLLNIITRGKVKLAAWTSETSVANVAFKIGGQHVYSTLSLGLNPYGSVGRPYWSLGFGLGVRVPVAERWYGEVEGTFDTLSPVPKDGVIWEAGGFATGLRVNVGFQLLDGVAVFAGPQVQVMASFFSNRPVAKLSPWGFDLASGYRLVPGVVLGAQFL